MHEPRNKTHIIFFVVFSLLIAGLLWSRALLSVAHVLVALATIVCIRDTQNVLKHPVVLWSCIPLLLFLAGWYQHPLRHDNYDYLLTLLMYPVAALAGFAFSSERKIFMMIFLIGGCLSVLYPIGYYIINYQEVNIAYGQGQSLPTLMEGDHVRYGIFLNSVLLMLATAKEVRPLMRNGLITLMVGVILFMAVRTAWVSCFILIIIIALSKNISAYRIFRKLIVAIVPVLVLAYFFIPTVKQKVNYTMYDYQQYAQKNISSSDGTRRAINYAGWQAIQSGAAGEGWSSIPRVITTNFRKLYPGEKQKFFWPFNQWLFWWIGGGFVAMLLFSAWLLYPIWWGIKNRNAAVVAWTLVIAASCIVESTIALQYGVFLHVWPLVFLWKKSSEQANDSRF
jgi:hypothetical protein